MVELIRLSSDTGGELDRLVYQGPMPTAHTARLESDKPKRKCVSCGGVFKPTRVRRVLCLLCYRRG